MAHEPALDASERPEPSRQMFGYLIASKPPRERRGAFTAGATSLVVHAAILGGLAWATMAVGKDVTHKDQIEIISIKD